MIWRNSGGLVSGFSKQKRSHNSSGSGEPGPVDDEVAEGPDDGGPTMAGLTAKFR